MGWSFHRTPFLIAGPCVIEPGDMLTRIAGELAAIERDLEIPVLLKASFDKANRSGLSAGRGPGRCGHPCSTAPGGGGTAG